MDAKGLRVNDNNVVLPNDGMMTYHNIYFNSYSAIDLSICSSDIALDFNWSINEYLHGSYHFLSLKFSRNVLQNATKMEIT